MAHSKALVLPANVVGLPEVVRLLRELEALHDYLHQAALRKATKAEVKPPPASPLLAELAKANDLDLLQREQYDWLTEQLGTIRKEAPQLHLAFSTEPSAAALQKIVAWIRQNIKPHALIHIGLEPNLAAGCLLRTANHQFDLSLKEHFAKSRPLLTEALRAVKPEAETKV
jgi:hypothetical protein